MRIRWIGIAVGALLLVPAIWSQVNSPTGPAPAKIATVSLQAAIVNTAEGKQASNELQSQFASRSTELQNMQKQMQELQTKLQSGATLSDPEREKLQRDGERLSRVYQRKQQNFQDDLNAAQQDVVNNIGRKLVDVVSQYSKENSYAVILDTSAQQSPVIYAAPQVDVTQEIIRLYDQSHPVKAATPPAKPATPSPTPKP
jgi:outer membrane protein